MSQGESLTSRGTGRALLLCLGLFALYVLIAAGTDLFDRDEPRFARAAVEMVRTGDYLLPQYNGNLRPDKPVLVYWAMAGPIMLLGAVESAVRLPSNVGMTAAVWFTFLIGRRMFSPRAGFEAAAMFGTCLLCLWIGTAATADGLLIGFMLLAMWPFVDRLYAQRNWWHLPVMGLAFGGALLTKGPVGLLPALTMVVGALALRKTGCRPPARFWALLSAALVIGLALFLAWGIPAALADWEIVRLGLGKHVLQRSVSAAEGHGASGIVTYVLTLPLYLPLIILGFFPWTLHLPGGVSALIRGNLGDRRERVLLWSWLVPTFIVMSLVVTKLPHYVLFIYPALALVSAAVLDAQRQGRLAEGDLAWLRGGVWFFGPVAWFGVIAAAAGGWLISTAAGIASSSVAALLVVMIVATWRNTVRQRPAVASRVAFGGTIVVVLAGLYIAAPQVEPSFKVSKRLAAAAQDELDAIEQVAGDAVGVELAMADYKEASLVFYLDRPPQQPVREMGHSPHQLAEWVGGDGPGLLFVTRSAWDAAQPVLPDGGRVRVVAALPVINYADRARQDGVLLVRRMAN